MADGAAASPPMIVEAATTAHRRRNPMSSSRLVVAAPIGPLGGESLGAAEFVRARVHRACDDPPVSELIQERAGEAAPPPPIAPGGALTFLFTDVEGSTRLWEQYPREMQGSLERHDVLLRSAIADADGDVVKTTGDGLMAVFGTPLGAVSAAIAAQRTLAAEPWPATCPIRVRMGIHTGEAEARGGDYFGPAVNRTARIMAAGHGGQILLSGATAGLVEPRLPADVSLRDLGEHRLKDLGRPERLLQLAGAHLPSDFPPLATLDRRPNNLPTQASAFVGREGVLADLRGRLDDDAMRLVTLTGPGGTGKTRLALRAAADQIDRFPDGVFFVDLISATDADGMLALVAAAVGLAETTERSPLNELRRHLRTQAVLLVLDNFEQVTVAAPALLELLADCPRLKLLVTSRQALRVRGENVVSVPPLSLPAAAAATADELSQFEAIQLFVERARAVRSDFRLTDDNASAVAEICRRLDGLPLAIELATARMNLFSPEALRDRLGSRLKLLGGGARDLPERQQTLRATIEWSYQLLDPAEQRLLELLSIFAGSSVEGVEAVAEGLDAASGVSLDAIDGLGSLLDKSLVRQAEPSAATDAPRIVMLETIREYAAEQLAAHAEFAAAVRDRHASYFADFAVEASPSIGDSEAAGAIEAVALEADNLRIAWRHWVGEGDLGRLTQLKGALWPLYDRRGWYHATVEVIRDMLGVLIALPDRPDHWQEELTLRTSLARALTLLRGYTGEVEDEYTDALALLRDHPDVPLLFPVLRSLASFHGFRGEIDKGLEYGQQILALAEAEGVPSMRVDGLSILGGDSGFRGELETGLGHLDEAIRIFESADYRPRRFRLGLDVRISALTTSGFFLWLLGRPDSAVTRADRAIALATELDHQYSLAYALFHNGFLHHWRREPEIVKARAEAAIRLADASDLPIWRALGTCLLGAATSSLGRPTEGLRQIADGLDQYQDLRTPPVFWPFLRFTQAGAHVEAGSPEPGLKLIDEAIAMGGPTNPIAPLFHVVRGDLSMVGQVPDVDAARDSYERAFALAGSLGSPSPQLRAALRLCRIASAAERPARLATLSEILEAFPEGRTAPDLVEAAGLLSSSGGSR
jgi:predicted ATPase/class 3 adenylate cyclase